MLDKMCCVVYSYSSFVEQGCEIIQVEIDDDILKVGSVEATCLQRNDCWFNTEEESAAFVQDGRGFFMNGFGHQKDFKAAVSRLLERFKVRYFADRGRIPGLGNVW